MNKKISKIGLLTLLNVYDEKTHTHVGDGWVVHSESKSSGRPDLHDFDGMPLPDEWYHLHSVSRCLTVITRSIH
jgi:hypothetical protein